MKYYLVLIFTSILMAFVTGHFFLLVQRPQTFSYNDKVNIGKIKTEFKRKVVPSFLIDFKLIYSLQDQINLIAPIKNKSFNKKFKTSFFISKKHCFLSDYSFFLKTLSYDSYKKFWIWEEFRCGVKKKLPSNFFSSSPFMHPSGKSYAYLAFLWGDRKNPYKSDEWIKKNIFNFHILELKNLKIDFKKFDEIFTVFLTLNLNSSGNIFNGKDFVITPKHVFFRVNDLYYPFSLKYQIYDIEVFREFVKRNSLYVLDKYAAGKSCLYRDGSMCWNYSIRHLFKMASKSTLYLFFGTMVTLFLLIALLLNRIRSQRIEENKRKMALRVLTHEFRTPVSSMLLNIENLNRYFDEFSEDVQDVFLHLSNDIYRLQRLTEKSQDYLRVQDKKKLFQFNNIKVVSINDFILSHLNPYLDQITFIPLKEDRSFTIDAYWPGICLKNLIENALSHGASPIVVSMNYFTSSNINTLKITIKDGGKCHFKKIDEMTQPFIKGSQSEGSGLGLNIVREIMKDMGGDVLYNSRPTRFTLVFKERKNE